MNKVLNCVPKVFLALCALVLSDHLWAAACSETFPSGLASATNSGSITIYGGNIYNLPSNQLVTKNLTSYTSTACNSTTCNKSDTIAQQAVNFTSFPGGSSVYVNYQETRNFPSSANFSSFGTDALPVLNFAPGDYTINGNVQLGSESRLNVSSSGTVRIFVNGNLDIGAEAQINMGTGGGTSRFVYFYTRGSFVMQTGADAKAVVYAKGDVTLNNNITLTGAITSEAHMYMHSGAALTYNASYITNTNFGSSCSGGGGATVNSFLIDIGGGSGSTCSAKAISITARDASNSKLTGYTGTISITTSTNRGVWAKTATAANAYGTFTGGADNGQASYTFTSSDAGDIILNLSNPRAQSLTITVTDSGAGKSSTSSTLIFSENAFVINTAADPLGDDLIARRDHRFTATMMRRDPITGACGAATDYNVSNLRMWLTRHSDDPAGAAPSAVIGSTAVPLPSIQPGSNNVNLSFVSGVASFWLRTTDVGKYAINLADTSNSFSNSTISGSSSTMVARPFGIRINVSANPGASNSSGPTFRKSGQPFTVTVTAVGWQSADDGNNDGIPDGHNDYDPTNNADLSNNLSLVSFATPIVLGSKLIQPAGGVESGLSGGAYSSFTVGSASAPDVAYGDVGIIELTAAISGIGNNYLGSPGSQKILGRSGYVGRFYPDHFRLSDLGVQSGCNSVLPYSYLEEPFSLTAKVTPYNAAGIAVQNYKDGFNKFNTNVFANMLSAIDEDTPVSLTSRITVTSDATAYSWNAGVLTAAPKIKINRSAAPDGPFPQVRVGFTPMDADGVTLRASDLNLDTDGDGTADAARIGTTTMGLRYGRLRLDDSYGPETTNLPVIFRTEYWDGSEWQRNRDDSCTQIALTDIAYPDGPISLVAHRSPAVGGGSTTGEYAELGASSVGFTEGDAGHYFTAPGAGNMGAVQVQVNLTNYPWLRFDWNNDGDFTDSSLPAANFTFGNYRGHDRVLYWIEAGGY